MLRKFYLSIFSLILSLSLIGLSNHLVVFAQSSLPEQVAAADHPLLPPLNTLPATFTCFPLNAQAATADTSEKPMSKVWNYEGKWWAVFPSSSGVPSSGAWLWRLDGATWSAVLKLSNSTSARADVKPSGSPVGSVVHILLYNGTSADLASAEYSSGTYVAWPGRQSLSSVSLPGSETATIDIDSTGRMWLNSQHDVTTPTNNREIIYFYSEPPYSTWSSSYTIATGTLYQDDISLVTALPNNTIGILWANENTHRFIFRYHKDSDPATTWSAEELPTSQYGYDSGAGFADDHLNVAIASDGTLYAVIKTGYDTGGYPRIALMVRRLSGTDGAGIWDANIYSVSNTGTRAIVLLDEVANELMVIYTSADGGGNIIFKQSATQPISFGAAQTMRTGTFNNVSSTKQNINSELVAIYSDFSNTIEGSFCTTSPPSGIDLSITNDDKKAGALPGDASKYVIEVSNPGLSSVPGVAVVDNFPSALTGITWSCTPSTGSSCTATGSGNISDSITLAASGSVKYVVYASISLAATGNVQNTATITAPPEITDPNPLNNTATDNTALRSGIGLCGSDPALVACYQLDETSGKGFLDGSQNTVYNDGTLIGDPAWSAGVLGSALNFNGSQYGYTVDEASLEIANQITIAAWLKPGAIGAQSVINKAVYANTSGYELSLDSASSGWPQKVFFRINQSVSGDTYRVNSTTIYPTDGTWIHVVATYDGSNMRMYINGVLEDTKTGVAINVNHLPLSIGAEFDGITTTRFYTGAMDDVRIYNRALSIDEVVALYTRPPGQPASANPSNGQENVQIHPPHDVPLSVNISDTDSVSLTVKFYGRQYCSLPNFTLAVIPDTQYYVTTANRSIFDSQTGWIVTNKAGRNIAFVSHLGDIVDSYSSTGQWDIAGKLTPVKGALTALDNAGIPYGLAIGNADGSPGNTANFNSYFPYTRFGSGHYGTDNDNNYSLFNVSGVDFILINIEYTANNPVRNWADAVLESYPTYRAIVVTHNLLVGSTSPAPFSTEGQDLFNAIKGNSNLFLMLGGHTDTEVMRTDVGTNGNIVYSLRSDYQTRTNGGDGWMRLMQFQPSFNQIQVSTYSPYLNLSETDADSEFKLQSSFCPFELIDTQTGATPGSNVTIDWANRLFSTRYEWYVTVSDGRQTSTGIVHTTSGPIWSFTTQENPTPVKLDTFTATSLPQGIQLSWHSVQEVDLIGFNLDRAESPDGPQMQINVELIPAIDPGEMRGNDYHYIDTSTVAGMTYYYWVVWVGIIRPELYGPLAAQLAPYSSWLPFGLKK